VDPVPGQGARNEAGVAMPPSLPGIGVTPEEGALRDPVAVYGG
jgi:hypothetical protein